MKHLSIIIILILAAGVAGGGFGYLWGYHNALMFARGVHTDAVDRMVDVAKRWKAEAEHHKFYLDKMCYENEKAKADIERLVEACANLQAERDIYYKELHKLLNSEVQ